MLSQSHAFPGKAVDVRCPEGGEGRCIGEKEKVGGGGSREEDREGQTERHRWKERGETDRERGRDPESEAERVTDRKKG